MAQRVVGVLTHPSQAILFLLLLTTLSPASTTTEATFNLPTLQGNPYDFTENDVQVTFTTPDNLPITIPAFYDGNTTWRARLTTTSPAKVATITLNNSPVDVPTELAHAQTKTPFIRLNPDRKRFTYDDNTPYYPLGYNLAWQHVGEPQMPSLPESLTTMGRAGVNWTRIWMNHWDGKSLDWTNGPTTQPPLGQLSLEAARKWDQLLLAADRAGISLQLVLQHHGQYSSRNDANWNRHPWNKANGGWLTTPTQFFSDPKAIALTKSKYRYILARYGHSPAVMAWELFNEFEYTDAFEANATPAIAAWHKTMAAFLRQHDPHKHLITTSSRTTESSVWPAMDYYQSHVYAPDLVSAIAALDAQQLDRAYFYGEIGSSTSSSASNHPDSLHTALWASLMSNSAGAAQYWHWYAVEPAGLLPHLTALRKFIDQPGFLKERLTPIALTIDTPEKVPLRFGPAYGWAPSRKTSFTVHPTGHIENIGHMSAYLQGTGANRAMFPFAELHVNYPTPGTFSVNIDEITRQGARLEIQLDNKPAASLTLAPPPTPPTTRPARSNTVRTDATLEIPVPAGPHTLRLESTGIDWVHLREFVLSPYSPSIAALAKSNSTSCALWLYRRDTARSATTQPTPLTATLEIPNLTPGQYTITWWDTHQGKPLTTTSITLPQGAPLKLHSPPIINDLAAWITRSPD